MPWHAYLAMGLAVLLLATLLVPGNSTSVAKPKFKLTSLTELSNNTSTTPINVDLTSASLESGEVSYGGQRSAWWSYTPTASYSVTFAAVGWNGNIAICVTTVINSCTTSSLSLGSGTVAMTSGTTYYIRVSPNSALRGTFIITRGTVTDTYVAPYDNFSNAQTIAEPAAGNPSAVVNLDLTNLTTEGGEAAVTGTAKTGWFKYTPTSSYTINLIQEGLGGNLATCVTTAIGSCSVGTNNGNGSLAYALTSGTTYYVRVNPNTATLGYIVIARAGTDNDNFANATAITELSPGTNTGSIAVNNINATSEVGEGNAEKGRWWKYTPTANQTINVSNGSALSGLSLNQCVTTVSSSCSLGYNSATTTALALTSGTTYYIRLGNADLGSFSISRAANDNDQFANATAVSELADGASTPTMSVNYATATTDPTEYSAGYHSRWWSYAPTVNQTLNVMQGGVGQNGNNNFYQCVTTAIGSCSVGGNLVNSTGSSGYALTAGATYYIRLTTYGATDGTARFFRSSADNDLFANATTIGELSAGANTGSINFDLSNAGTENGEVNLGSRSRWWKYTPTATYSITIAQTTSGAASSSATYQCVTTSVSTCSLASNSVFSANAYSYSLTSGTTYYFRVSTAGSDIGSFRITRSGSDNDTFANATVISELSAGTTTPVISADLSTASKESGESGSGNRSRWWSYTPTTNQTINVNETTPSTAQSGVIYQCVTTTFGSCTLGDNGNYGKAVFAYNLTSGTTYYIRIATPGADTIAFTVSRAANDNDLIANATAISELVNNTMGSPIAYDLTNASIEPGEVGGAGSRSRWWSYTPTSSYSLRIDQGVFDSGASQAESVCVTISIGSCSVGVIASYASGGASYSLTSGTTYYIRIATGGPLSGSFVLSRGTVVDSYVPPNDNFASATTLTELSANAKGTSQSVDLTNATVEGGEISYGNAKSAWWKYTPTSSYTLDIAVSGITGNMASCMTTSITTCTQGSQLANGLWAYALTAGTTYYIRLSPNTGAVGTFMIWRTNTGNDNFANATAISELSAGTSSSFVNVDTSSATYEPNEVITAGDRRSLWWSYTPTSSYTVDLVNYGAGGDLSYCLTTSIASCTQGSSTTSGMFGFSLTSGTTYYLRVSGAYQSPYGAFRLVRAGTANNDMFANATSISEVAAGSVSSTISYDLTGATIESGEASNGENRSLWWSYTPTSSYTINVAIAGENGPTASCITTSMTSCTTATATGSGTYAAALTSGTTYYIRVSSNGGSTGTFSVRRAGSNNDNFANATAISELAVGASSGLIAVDTRNATIEPGEVSNGEQRSLWWSYTPTSSYTVDVMAYSLGGDLSVCIATSIASCSSYSNSSNTGVAMTSGTTYYIRMAGNGSNLSGLQLIRTGAGNDNFANATAITELTAGAASGGLAFDTSTATVESGEANYGQQRSLWWKYTPTASYTINAAINGDGGSVGVCITTVIGSCTNAVTSTSGIVAASLTSGTTYYIRVASNGWSTGTLLITRANTGNDNFANASTVQQSDITAPTTGNVYDGTVTNTETPNNNGSTTSLSANWSGFADSGTGIANYDYSIGTSAGDTSVKAWTSNGTTTSVTATGLSLTVGSKYFFNVRATDFASNTSSVVSSTGQTVAPILTFTSSAVASATSCGDVTTTAASGATSSYVDPGSSTAQVIFGQQLSVTTNAANGYTVNVSATPLSYSTKTIAAVPGTNAAPQTWPAAGTEGFGYATSSSTLSGTASRFRTAKFAAFSTAGAEVMRNTAAASGDSACIAMGLSQSASTAAGLYASTVTFTAIPTF